MIEIQEKETTLVCPASEIFSSTRYKYMSLREEKTFTFAFQDL